MILEKSQRINTERLFEDHSPKVPEFVSEGIMCYKGDPSSENFVPDKLYDDDPDNPARLQYIGPMQVCWRSKGTRASYVVNPEPGEFPPELVEDTFYPTDREDERDKFAPSVSLASYTLDHINSVFGSRMPNVLGMSNQKSIYYEYDTDSRIGLEPADLTQNTTGLSLINPENGATNETNEQNRPGQGGHQTQFDLPTTHYQVLWGVGEDGKENSGYLQEVDAYSDRVPDLAHSRAASLVGSGDGHTLISGNKLYPRTTDPENGDGGYWDADFLQVPPYSNRTFPAIAPYVARYGPPCDVTWPQGGAAIEDLECDVEQVYPSGPLKGIKYSESPFGPELNPLTDDFLVSESLVGEKGPPEYRAIRILDPDQDARFVKAAQDGETTPYGADQIAFYKACLDYLNLTSQGSLTYLLSTVDGSIVCPIIVNKYGMWTKSKMDYAIFSSSLEWYAAPAVINYGAWPAISNSNDDYWLNRVFTADGLSFQRKNGALVSNIKMEAQSAAYLAVAAAGDAISSLGAGLFSMAQTKKQREFELMMQDDRQKHAMLMAAENAVLRVKGSNFLANKDYARQYGANAIETSSNQARTKKVEAESVPGSHDTSETARDTTSMATEPSPPPPAYGEAAINRRWRQTTTINTPSPGLLDSLAMEPDAKSRKQAGTNAIGSRMPQQPSHRQEDWWPTENAISGERPVRPKRAHEVTQELWWGNERYDVAPKRPPRQHEVTQALWWGADGEGSPNTAAPKRPPRKHEVTQALWWGANSRGSPNNAAPKRPPRQHETTQALWWGADGESSADEDLSFEQFDNRRLAQDEGAPSSSRTRVSRNVRNTTPSGSVSSGRSVRPPRNNNPVSS